MRCAQARGRASRAGRAEISGGPAASRARCERHAASVCRIAAGKAAGAVKVLDFGLARVDNPELTNITHTGAILGTPAYMSPEQARGQRVDFRTDQFALGLLIYEMASGTNPFVARNVTATLVRIMEGPRRPCPSCAPTFRRASIASWPGVFSRIRRNGSAAPRRSPTNSHSSRMPRPIGTGRPRTGLRRHAPNSRLGWTPLGWWKFHQATVAAAYVLVLYPVWRVRVWLPAPWGMLFLLSTLLCTAAAVSLRLHLLFMAKHYVSDLAEQHDQTYLWIRLSDAGFAAALIAAAVGIGTEHPELAMLLVAVGTAAIVGSMVIEPATTKAAFRRSGIWKDKR